MLFTKMCPSSGTEYVSFELFLGVLRGSGEGRGGAPGTAPLQNPEVTSFKNLLMPLFLMGCFPGDLKEGKRPIKASGETAH